MTSFFKFLWLLLSELLTHKWFKALLLAIGTVFVIEKKDQIVSFVQSYNGLGGLALFGIYFLRFLLPEMFPKKSFSQLNVATLKLDQLRSGRNLQITILAYTYNQNWGQSIVWDFDHSLRAIPVLALSTYRLKTEFEGILSDIGFTPYANSPTRDTARFKLEFLINHPRYVVEEVNPLDFFEELTFIADARPFGLNSYYSKILSFFSDKMKSIRIFKHFC